MLFNFFARFSAQESVIYVTSMSSFCNVHLTDLPVMVECRRVEYT
jgi:hypothetical protein